LKIPEGLYYDPLRSLILPPACLSDSPEKQSIVLWTFFHPALNLLT
jgi:hypothetical protein